MKWSIVPAIIMIALTSVMAAENGQEGALAELRSGAPNRWVKLDISETGGRKQPLFIYATGIKRFIFAGGVQGKGSGKIARHYDTESFDPATLSWVNEYPAGLEAGRPLSGPLDEAYAKQREMHGYNGLKGPFYSDGDSQRILTGGQWAGNFTRSYAWCYVPESGLIYLAPDKYTCIYDTVKRTWTDAQCEPRNFSFAWGSMCYDPINKEILYNGGGSGSAEVRTWIYGIDANKWRLLECGSEELRNLWQQSQNLCWEVKTILGRCANRHAVSESEEEAKVDLTKEAQRVGQVAQTLRGALGKSALKENEGLRIKEAGRRLALAIEALTAVAPTLAGKIDPAKLAAVRAGRERFEQVVDALAPEPPGRARSQMAYDPLRKKILLFGGDGLDRTLSDTWLYDCTTRRWEQHFPATVPAPRAGHILTWLPKAQCMVLAGGYSRTPLPQEIWIYDGAANSWKCLMQAERQEDAPVFSLLQSGAVTENDLLVCVTSGQNGDQRITWGCRVEPKQISESAGKVESVVAGSYTWQTISPAKWEEVAGDPAETSKFLEGLPPNQWTAYSFPLYAPGARNRWGTSAYDSERHQMLLWGGGHATSHENDVAHFSVRAGFWTLGYAPDAPIEPVYASQPTELSFHDRAHVPMHAYRSYTYDPPSQRMFYLNYAYNLRTREWESEPLPGLEHRGCMNTHLRPTPKGAVAVSSKGIFRYDNEAKTWDKLPLNGKLPSSPAYCDGPCMIYDSKRDVLWMTYQREILKYEFATGVVTPVEIVKPKALDNYLFMGEAVYHPESDLIMAMCPQPKGDGTFGSYAWNPNDAKFYWLDLRYVEGGKKVEFKRRPFTWHDALAYDAKLNLMIINNSAAAKVWALRFDPATVKREVMVDPQE